MTLGGLVRAYCEHARSSTGNGKGCPVCFGFGWVAVVPAQNGSPAVCEHAHSSSGDGKGCGICLGSGWAGLVVLKR